MRIFNKAPRRMRNLARLAGIATILASLGLANAAQAHSDKQFSGPGAMSASANGQALWQFPDKRALNPAIFGTPAAPLNVDLLPLSMRDTNANGTAYTTIKSPAAFSNNIKMITGEFALEVKDVTAKDSPNSADKVALDASFVGPNGKTYRVVMNKVIPVGPEHPFYGGVGTDILMHGATGIGTPLVAQEFSYITVWGLGDLYIDGKLADTMRIIHVMVSERTRNANFKIGFGVAEPDKLEIHLMLPPQKGAMTGPVDSPVPTGLMLPNGKEQPFIHVNFYGNAKLEGDRFYDGK
ncbi:hypothetical protein MNBD_ALPHA12-1163 [hydrothermal vent metagenome]|uniref:Uncharacterized protein n=1 Tax=hydrothermal vent metagenome TaxID=652676 RepID=A0A3B0THR4_9ZZZZ